MSACVKCGHNPDRSSCPHCGYPDRTAMVVEGVAVYFCCGKPLAEKVAEPKPVRGGVK